MTMPEGSAEEPEIVLWGSESKPFHVVSSTARPSKRLAPEFGRFKTVVVSSAIGPYSITPGAQQLFPRSLRRNEGRFRVVASAVAQTVTDGVIISSKEAITSGVAAIGSSGGYYPIGTSDIYKGQGELWVCQAPGNSAIVYVTIEDCQYASDPESFRETQ